MPSVFQLRGFEGTDDEPWQRRYPWLGFVVAIGGPFVAGFGLLYILTKAGVIHDSRERGLRGAHRCSC
jgi:hypothetical protein